MFLPLKDDNPTQGKPVATLAVIALNVLIYLYQFSLDPRPETLFVYRFGLVPGWLGSSSPVDLPALWLPRWTTLFSYMFLHSGFLHLGSNMLYLWIFGNNIEDVLGPLKFMGFYLAGGLAAAGAQIVIAPESGVPMVGASGSIAAVLGAYLVLFPRNKVTVLIWLIIWVTFVKIPAMTVLGLWFLLQVFSQYTSGSGGPGVAFMAHIGGFVFGMFVMFAFRPKAGRRGG